MALKQIICIGVNRNMLIGKMTQTAVLQSHFIYCFIICIFILYNHTKTKPRDQATSMLSISANSWFYAEIK